MDSIKRPTHVVATFKSTRVVFSQSSETQKAHLLNFAIRHNFGDIGGKYGGSHTLYGLDVASDIYIGFDYGISDRLTVSAGRSREDELYNFAIKYKLIEQTHGHVPLTITVFAQPGLITRKPFQTDEFLRYGDRGSYFFQAIFAKKFTSRLSLEVSPSFLHQSKTLFLDPSDRRNLVTVGIAGRFKITKRFALLGDYQLVNGLSRNSGRLTNNIYYNPLGAGFEIETGGHVFSILFANTPYALENNFIPNTQKSWRHGGIRLAFNISRSFRIGHKKNPTVKDETHIK